MLSQKSTQLRQEFSRFSTTIKIIIILFLKNSFLQRSTLALPTNSVAPTAVAYSNHGNVTTKTTVKTAQTKKIANIHLVLLENSLVPITDAFQCLK